MANYDAQSAGGLRFSDQISDPATTRPARLSALLFDSESATSENNRKRHLWSKGLIFESIHASKPSQPDSILLDNRSSDDQGGSPSWLRNILWPMMAIIVPTSLLAGVIIGLVCGYRVQTEQSLFRPSDNANESVSSAYVLVNYSATRLVFVASWLSTTAPILASFVMVLWSLPIAQTIRTASTELDADQLPTPYQLSLLIGITLASMQRLRRYLEYGLSRSRPRIPPVLHKAALILILCVLLACGVFIADTALHYYTETVAFSKYSTGVKPMYSFSRGPSDACLSWNRTDSFCLPCTVPMWSGPAPGAELLAEEDELFLLQNNKSRKSEIRLVQDPTLGNADLAILLPQVQAIPADVDFHGITMGVSTQCSFISQDCSLRRSGYQDFDTQFNCSESFYGVLGLPPVLSDSGNAPNKTADSNVPPLNWKPFLGLQYGYYMDAHLEQPYATGAFNASTGAMDSSGSCLPDAELINPVYLGVAGRFDTGPSSPNLTNDPGILLGADTSYADFVLSCSYTTYEVGYDWFNGTVQAVSITKSPNGTLAEMYHGSQMYASVMGGAHDLVLNIVQATQEATGPEFIRSWGGLYSVKVLSSLGAYGTARPTSTTQQRTVLLVTRVPIVALGFIIACSLAYVVLGLALGFAAFQSSSSNVQDLAARLSLAGLTAAAFEERDGTGNHERIIQDPDSAFSKQEDGTRRVAAEGLAQTGYILNPVVSQNATPLHSRSASSRETIS